MKNIFFKGKKKKSKEKGIEETKKCLSTETVQLYYMGPGGKIVSTSEKRYYKKHYYPA